MKDFSIIKYISPEVRHKFQSINIINEKILSFFSKKDYGSGVETLYIGLNCMNPDSIKALKLKKPKYIGPPKIIKTPAFEDIIVEKTIEYEFVADYSKIMNAYDDTLIEAIKLELIDSIAAIDVLEIPDFNKEKFKNDFIECVSKIQV